MRAQSRRVDCSTLLYTAELSICIFGAKTEFGFVVFQVKQLLGVEGSATFPDKEKEEVRINCSSFAFLRYNLRILRVSSSTDTKHGAVV